MEATDNAWYNNRVHPTFFSQSEFAMKTILHFSILFCFAKVNSQNVQVCNSNEISDPCKNPCQPTCESPTPPICEFLWCQQGCVCKPNLIRKTDLGECIPPNQCPRVPTCNATNNEQFFNCTSPCIRTCQSQCRPRELCPTAGCARLCDCKYGYIRNELTSQCIPERNCPKCSNCPQNEVYTQCGAGCVATCQNPEKCYAVDVACTAGCVCEQGLIRDERSKKCITFKRCSQIR